MLFPISCSDVTAADVDTEAMKILRDSYKQAKKLLKENRDIMDKLAAYLIEKETITGKEFMKIFRKEKGLPEPEENDSEKDGGKSTAEQKREAKPQQDNAQRQVPRPEQPVHGQQPTVGAFQQPYGQPSAPGAQQSPYGQPSVPGALQSPYGQPSAPGAQQSPYGQPSMADVQQTPYGEQTTPGTGQPTYGQQAMKQEEQAARQPGQDTQEQAWIPPSQLQSENRGLFSNAPEPRDDDK